VHLIGADFHEAHRHDRISALLEDRADHDVESMRSMQSDTRSLAAEAILPGLLKLEPATGRQRAALDRLGSWDADLGAGSPDAAIYELWISAIERHLFADRLGEDLFTAYEDFREVFVSRTLPALLAHSTDRVDPDALRAALDEALDEVGDRTWGDIHRLVLAHPLARIPGLDEVFVAAAFPYGGDEGTISQGAFEAGLGYRPAVIPSVRAVWDLGDLERSTSVVPSGVSGNPASPHWADQSALFATGAAKPAGFRTAAVATLNLRPSEPVPSGSDA
jgi:penicillin amidase